MRNDRNWKTRETVLWKPMLRLWTANLSLIDSSLIVLVKKIIKIVKKYWLRSADNDANWPESKNWDFLLIAGYFFEWYTILDYHHDGEKDGILHFCGRWTMTVKLLKRTVYFLLFLLSILSWFACWALHFGLTQTRLMINRGRII